jgi:hypothetical protein
MPAFFINGTSLSNSTAVFLDSEQLICAPDGYYSDGVTVRQQIGCSLVVAEILCPTCSGDCPIAASSGLFQTRDLIYSVSTNIGSQTGAILINFNTNNIVTGIIVEFNGAYYNELSSPTYGYLAAPPNLVTYIGRSDQACFCPELPTTGCTYVLEKRYWNGTAFVPIAGTEVVNITAPQLQLTPTGSGSCVMVVPKTLAVTQTINVYAYKICYQNNFEIEISCAEPLPTFQASNKFDSPSDPAYCGSGATTNTFYVAKVSNDNPAPFVDINDWVFQDENGENKLEDGYYLTFNIVGAYDTIQVVNGVVVATTLECP